MWCYYIAQLHFFGKDTNNPKYACPDNLHEQHDLYMKKRKAYNEREELEKKRQKARENEAKFKKLKGKFFGIAFTDGTIQVRVLESVDEYIEEGTVGFGWRYLAETETFFKLSAVLSLILTIFVY